MCAIPRLGDWAADLPARLWHLAVTDWPWLAAAAVLVLLLGSAGWVAHRAAWRRAVLAGYWLQVTPPRWVDPMQADRVWRLLRGLARRAAAGRRPVRPPLAFEIHSSGGRLVAGLWLPSWVPWRAAVAEVGRAWPGARVERRDPPSLPAGWPVAAFWMRAAHPDTGPLTDDVRPPARPPGGPGGDGDPLAAVLDGLAEAAGPALLQVLARPAPRRRITQLRHAARYPTTPPHPAHGLGSVGVAAVRALLDAITALLTTGRPTATGRTTHPRASDPLAAAALRRAADKLEDRPHLVAAIRVGAAGASRDWAGEEAGSIAGGFVHVSSILTPTRLRRAAVVLAERRARRAEWLLCSAAELGVLAHLPTDPAVHRFDTEALHRRQPVSARRAEPERATGQTPGWTPAGWTHPRRAGDHR